MPVFLYVVGGFITIAGLFALGFSIPIRGFDVGNALIGAGATGAVGGLILIGLGSGIRELRRLSRALQAAGQGLGNGSRAEALGKPVRSSRVTGPIPVAAARPAAPEAAYDEMDTAAGERGRPSIFAVVRGGGTTEHFEIDETDNVPLSPGVAPRAAERAPEPEFEDRPSVDPHVEARPTSPSSIASRAAARLDLPRATPEPVPARAGRPSRSLFDTVWPNESKRAAEPASPRAPLRPAPERAPAEHPASGHSMFVPPETEPLQDPFDLHAAVKEAVESLVPEAKREVRPEPKPNLRAPPRFDARPGPKFDPRPESRQEVRAEPKAEARSDAKATTILKSGVIDGMAYTLYTDGSIEAQLPDGVMRFASIDDLRIYLERSA